MKITTTLRVDEELLDAFRARAAEKERSLNWEIVATLRAALGEQEGIQPAVRELTAPSRSPSVALATRDEVRRVYDHWRAARGRTDAIYDRPLEERLAKIRTRMKRFTPEQLCHAIDGVARDPWEDRPLHDDLKIIFRSDAQVEKFLDLAERGPASNGKHVSAADVLGAAARLAREGR